MYYSPQTLNTDKLFLSACCPYLITLIGGALFIGGMMSNNFFAIQSELNCQYMTDHIGLIQGCSTEPAVNATQDRRTQSYCFNHANLNSSTRAVLGLFGTWLALFALYSLLQLSAACLHLAFKPHVARRLSSLALGVLALSTIFMIVSFTTYVILMKRNKIQNQGFCQYGPGFAVALAGLIVSLLGALAVLILLFLAKRSPGTAVNTKSPRYVFGPYYSNRLSGERRRK
ncbi:hypothetical protein ACOME3_001105 [Neoechinorhynchus agilis]